MPSMRHRLRSKPDEQKKLLIRVGESSPSSAISLVPRKRGRPSRRAVHNDQTVLPELPAFQLLDPKVSCPVLASVLTRSLNLNPMTASELHEMQREVELMLTRTALCYKGVLNFYNRLSGKVSALELVMSDKQEATSCNGIGPTKIRQTGVSPTTTCRGLASAVEIDQRDAGPSFSASNVQPSPTSSRFYQFSNNMAPDRFWALVSTYLKMPTEEDIAFLNQLIKDSDSEVSSCLLSGNCAIPSTSSAESPPLVDSPFFAGQPCAKLKVRDRSSCTNGTTDWFRQRRSASHRDDPSVLDSASSLPDSSMDDTNWFPTISKLSKYVMNSLYRPMTRRQSLEEDNVPVVLKSDAQVECSTDMTVDDDVALELAERQAELRLLQTANSATLLYIKQEAETMRSNEAKIRNIRQIEDALIELSRKMTVSRPTLGEMSRKEVEHVWKLIRDLQRLKDEIDPC